MDFYISVLEVIATVLSISLGLVKLLPHNFSKRASITEDKVSLLRSFVNEEDKVNNQLFIEYLFSYILGHKKLSADEINYLFKTDNPTQTIDRYIESRSYVEIRQKEEKIVLKKPFLKQSSLKIFRAILFLLYTITSITALILVFYVIPHYVSSNNTTYTFTVSLLCLMFGVFSITSILEARRVNDALSLINNNRVTDRNTHHLP